MRRTLRPHPVFADTGLRAGQVWPEQLDAELRRCAALVALIGPTLPAGIGALADWQAVPVDPTHLPDGLMRIERAVRGVLY